MGGAQPLAATFAGATSLNIECQQSSIDFRLRTGYVDKQANDLDHAYELIKEHTSKGEAVSIALLGNAAQILPQIVQRAKNGDIKPDFVTDQTSAHDLIHGYLPIGWTVDKIADEYKQAQSLENQRHFSPQRQRQLDGCYCHNRWQARPSFANQAWLAHEWHTIWQPLGSIWHIGLGLVGQPSFCQGKGPFRWVALSGDPEDIYKTDQKIKELFPENTCASLAGHGKRTQWRRRGHGV